MDRCVGPFFYINEELKSLLIAIKDVKPINGFINHEMSHFTFFNRFNHDELDDYGHYPRGRVIYNVNKDRFVVYLDTSLYKSDKVKKEIINTYGLDKSDVVFRKDSHYTHDYL